MHHAARQECRLSSRHDSISRATGVTKPRATRSPPPARYKNSPCPAGTYSGARTGLTDSSQCLNCTVGHYCPEASSQPTACGSGTYQPLAGVGDAANCRDCDAGWACPTSAIAAPSVPCDPGYYCPAGSSSASANACPAGAFTDRRGPNGGYSSW
jgi:hypothetical protein